MKIEFKENTIYGHVLDKAIIIENNENKENNFIKYLDEVINNTNKKTERDCAKKAKELYANDRKSLRDFIIDNLSTFTTGTFATVSGGLLLSTIQEILKS